MALAYFDANTCSSDELITSMDQWGYVMIKNALDIRQLTLLQKELEPHFAERPESKAQFFGFKTKRIEALFSKSIVAQQMAVHPLVLQVSDHILSPNCDSLQVNLTQGI